MSADIFDEVSGGFLPIQHHDRAYDIPERRVLKAVRSKGLDDLDRDQIDEKAGVADALGTIIWPHEPGAAANAIATGVGLTTTGGTQQAKPKREIPAWGFGFPAIAVEASRPEGKVFKVRVRPIGDATLSPDRRFKVLDVLTPSSVASGARGTLMAITEEYAQVEVFLPAQSSLVAVHYGGPASAGSRVHDVDGKGEIDPTAAGTLQHLTRVHFAPKACAFYGTAGDPGLAIQVGQAAGGIQGGILADGGQLAALMHQLGGAFHLGIAAEDKHYHGANKRNETYGPVHMNPKVPWIKSKAKAAPGGGTRERTRDTTTQGGGPSSASRADEVQDGPLKFTDEEVRTVNPLPGVDVETRLVYDPIEPHSTPCGARQGVFKWVTKVPLYVPPPPPGDDDPGHPGRPGGGGGGGGGGDGGGGGGKGGGPFGPLFPKPGEPDPGPQPLGPNFPKPNGPTTPKPIPIPLPPPPLPKPGEPGSPERPLINLQPPWVYNNDPCRRAAVSTLNEFAFPAMSYQAPDPRPQTKEYLYSRDWTTTDAARESKSRPTVLRTDVIARNNNGLPVMTRKAPCPYPGGTAEGWVVDFPPEESPTDGPTAAGSSSSGRAACRTKTAWACPEEDGTVTGFVAENVGGVLTIDSVTSNVSDGTATLEIDSGAGTLKFNGSSLSGSPFPYGGDGSDGAALFDGSTTVAGASRSGSVYTLTRSTNYTDATVSSGVTVKPAGHLLQGTGTLLNQGKIERNGGDATSTAGGAAPGGTQGIGSAGATGRTTSGNGAGGSALTAALGGDGGNGGSTGGSTGGTGGLASSSRPAATTQPLYTTAPAVLNNGRMMTLTAALDPSGGGSGAAGGFEVGAVGRSGSGGASAGNIQLIFQTINTSAGTIEAKGGNAYVAAGTGDMGGGGGGGGGCIRAVARTYVGWSSGSTVLVTKGLKSNGIGAGTAGTDGTDGQVFAFLA